MELNSAATTFYCKPIAELLKTLANTLIPIPVIHYDISDKHGILVQSDFKHRLHSCETDNTGV
jgi:hypothetical protein